MVAALTVSSTASAATVVARVNFQPQNASVPTGYQKDFGEAFNATRGYGWVAQGTPDPLSIVGNGRERNAVTNQRLDTLMQMQYSGTSGVAVPARWELAIPDGSYDVTVSVGDASFTDSVHKLAVEGVVAISNFQPTSTEKFRSKTVRVTVADGRLTLDAAGGENTKINYIDVAQPQARVLDVDPDDGATGVSVTTSVTLSLSDSADTASIGPSSVQLRDPTGAQISGAYNSDAAGALVSFTPATRLSADTTYTVETTSNLLTSTGAAFEVFRSAFTTGSSGIPPAPLSFDRLSVGNVTGPTVVTIGPDGKLYAANAVGQIRRYTLGSNGLPTGGPEVFAPFGAFERTILGLRFDPRASASNLKLWVSHGALGFDDMPNFTGKVSVLTGANLATARDVISGLPRSSRDHMNNGIDFGPDGRLYVNVGSLSGYGAPDKHWGFRAETPLSAAILVADVNRDSRFDGTVNVNTSAGYDPDATGAPVKVYASGIRNPYDLVWHTNGLLYVPVNESASGNAPAGPGGDPPALNDLPAGRDFLARVRSGRYYGHPNPSRGHFVLNGGNPTRAEDPFEQARYPVGQLPDPKWDKPVLDLGLHRSPNGVTEYTSNAFGGALLGQLLIAEFSNGDDVLAVEIDATGGVGKVSQVEAGFYNPLDVTVNASNGNIYVAEYGSQPEGTGGKITLLRPKVATTPVSRVNFQSKSAPVPPSYQRDYGQAFSATRGYGWIEQSSKAPLSIVGNGRDANSVADQRLDTLMHMQYTGSTGGVAVPARWQHSLANGTYDVTVSVGDARQINGVHRITVEGVVAVDNFKPTTRQKFKAATVRVKVADGLLTLDAAGGTNTKINYVEIASVP
ncbi:MAG: Ig-like domain-containing protein [Actinomycetota bacterium]|nr:Ig-like domain-containing protein [Actinomycetota bacterium]